VLWIRDGLLSETWLPLVYPYTAFSTSEGIWIVKDNYAIQYLYNPVALPGAVVIALELDGGIWGDVYPDVYDGGTWGSFYADLFDGGVWGDGSGGQVVPLTWQSKFNGYSDRVRQSLDRFLFRVYKGDKLPSTVAIEYTSYREDGQHVESRTVDVGTISNPYDPDGYAMLEFVPANKNTIASSIKLTCNDKIVILDGYATVTVAGDSVAKNRG